MASMPTPWTSSSHGRVPRAPNWELDGNDTTWQEVGLGGNVVDGRLHIDKAEHVDFFPELLAQPLSFAKLPGLVPPQVPPPSRNPRRDAYSHGCGWPLGRTIIGVHGQAGFVPYTVATAALPPPSVTTHHDAFTHGCGWPPGRNIMGFYGQAGLVPDTVVAAAMGAKPEPRPLSGTSHDYSYHARVPREPALGQGHRVPITTLVIDKVCRRVFQAAAMRRWPRGEYNYDLFYLAYDLKRKTGTGRVFINFVTQGDAAYFYKRWNGQVCPGLSATEPGGRPKALKITLGHRQGFVPNVEYWQSTLRCADCPDFAPVLFCGGRQLDVWSYDTRKSAGAARVPTSLGLISL